LKLEKIYKGGIRDFIMINGDDPRIIADCSSLDASEVWHSDSNDVDEELFGISPNNETARLLNGPPREQPDCEYSTQRSKVPLFSQVYIPIKRGNEVWLRPASREGNEIYLGRIGDRKSAQFLADSNKLIEEVENFSEIAEYIIKSRESEKSS
jgi:hypothetical protein